MLYTINNKCKENHPKPQKYKQKLNSKISPECVTLFTYLEVMLERSIPWLRIVRAATEWAFLRTRNRPQLSSYPVISSQQICIAVIPRTGLRTRTMNLRSWVTSSRPHSHMRKSRNKNMGHVDTWSILLNILSLAASWMTFLDLLYQDLFRFSLLNQPILCIGNKSI